MLRFERDLVDALSSATDPGHREAVVAWVDGSLAAMPDVLRLGVAAGSLAVGTWARARGLRGAALLQALERSPLPPVRQHLRLIRSLVLFGDIELEDRAVAHGGAAR